MYYLLLGGPKEDRDTVRTTLDIAEETDPTNVFMMIGLRIYPDTELETIARSENIISGDLIKPAFYLSSAFNKDAWYDIDNYINNHKNSIIQLFSRENCIDFFVNKENRSLGIPRSSEK